MDNKLYKEINNIKDLLDGKYNERDILLKEGNIDYFHILDNEIQNMELEIKKLENQNDMNINDNFNNYKTQLCKYYKKYGKCNKSDKCLYTHELKNDKKECINNLNCYDETCLFEHPNNWTPYNNNIESMVCVKGFCNKKNKKYLHIKNNSKFKFIVNKIILINKIIKYLNKYIKKEDVKTNINPEINLTINCNYINDNPKIDNKQNINNLLYKMENNLDLYSKKIIENINNLNIDDCLKINMKIQINYIKSKIILLKYNMEDIGNYRK